MSALVSLAIGAAALVMWPSYDFVCDDAFIALRYAKHLAQHGAPVYNLGEAVEGYSSFSWVVLLAVPLALGTEPELAFRVVSLISSLALLFSTAYLWRCLRAAPASGVSSPESASTPSHVPNSEHETSRTPGWGAHLGCWASLLLLLLSASAGAWAFGGLETPLFSALLTLSIALTARLADTRQLRYAVWAGLAWGGAALTRPETPLAFACCALALAFIGVRQAKGDVRWRDVATPLLTLFGVFSAIVLTHFAWRLSYYGLPLPNTFYAKTSSAADELLARGIRYTGFTLSQLGLPMAGVLALLLPAGGRSAGHRLVLWTARLWVPAHLAYVTRIGGDFLDLGRFYVPLLPLLSVLLVDAWSRLVTGVRARRESPFPGFGIALLVALGGAALLGHGWHQYAVGMRALAVSDRAKGELGIEPLGWTRRAALRWAATGRWLAAHSREQDWMAVGAAGAMPYYAGLPNLDTFGLCDAHVARHGKIVSSRPGHQRFASRRYILSKRPVFIFVGDTLSSSRQSLPREHHFGEDYVWVQAVVSPQQYGAPKRFWHRFLMRRDRVRDFAQAQDLEHQ